jgi:GNAT superfamily N-acetyltransferase
MSEYDDPAHFSQAYTLRDGTPVVMRALRPDDLDKVVAAFNALDPESVYTRFHSQKRELSGADLDLIRSIDFVHSIMLVVTRQAEEGERIIGGVSCFFAPRDKAGTSDASAAESAEIAFTVEEDYQRQGLAGLLLRVLVSMLRIRGTATLSAEVLADNVAMLKVFERSGLPMHRTRDSGVVHVELSLKPTA